MNMPLSRADCLALDQDDSLAALRNEFNLPADMIYLDGNSLGAQPKAALSRAQQVISQEWGQDLITNFNKTGLV